MKRLVKAVLATIIGTCIFIFSCGDSGSANKAIEKILNED